MKANEEKYFNVPIQLYEGFMSDSRKCLDNVYDYAIYKHSLKLDQGDDIDKIASSCNFFNTTSGNKAQTLKNGKKLLNSIPQSSPMTGISVEMYFDFYKTDKEPFEKALLLSFLALKSIVGRNQYAKTDNRLLLARMDGKVNSIKSFSELSHEISFYTNEYQTVKLKKALQRNWGLIHYSRYTRGFYFSFSLTLDQLVLEAERRRLNTWEKKNKFETDEARKKALGQLFNR